MPVPDNELLEISGIAEKRAALLSRVGINSLDDFCSANADEIARLFGPPVTVPQIHEMQDFARHIKAKKKVSRRRKLLVGVFAAVPIIAGITTLIVNSNHIRKFFESSFFLVKLFPEACPKTSKCNISSTGGELKTTSRQQIHIGVPYRSLKDFYSERLCLKVPFFVELQSKKVVDRATIELSIRNNPDSHGALMASSGYPNVKIDDNACRIHDTFLTHRMAETEVNRLSIRKPAFLRYIYEYKNIVPGRLFVFHVAANVIPNTFTIQKSTNRHPYGEDNADFKEFSAGDSVLLFHDPIRIDVSQNVDGYYSDVGGADVFLHFINVDSDLYARSLLMTKNDYTGHNFSISNLFFYDKVRTVFVLPQFVGIKADTFFDMEKWKEDLIKEYSGDGKHVDQMSLNAIMHQSKESHFYLWNAQVQDSFYVEPETLQIANRLSRLFLADKRVIDVDMGEYNSLRNQVRAEIMIQRQMPRLYWSNQFKKYGIREMRPD